MSLKKASNKLVVYKTHTYIVISLKIHSKKTKCNLILMESKKYRSVIYFLYKLFIRICDAGPRVRFSPRYRRKTCICYRQCFVGLKTLLICYNK